MCLLALVHLLAHLLAHLLVLVMVFLVYLNLLVVVFEILVAIKMKGSSYLWIHLKKEYP